MMLQAVASIVNRSLLHQLGKRRLEKHLEKSKPAIELKFFSD
jgi:hypothetical protein